MKQSAKKTRHVAVRTVWLSVISSIIVGLTSLVLGLSIYSNSLMQESIAKALAILDDMVKEGSLDGDLLALFKESHAGEAEV